MYTTKLILDYYYSFRFHKKYIKLLSVYNELFYYKDI